MRFRAARHLALLGICTVLRGSDPHGASLAPAKNWVLPLFTPDGFHAMTLSGDEVHPISSERIDVVNIFVTAFSGDAAARVDYILISPAASCFPQERRASGPAQVRFIRSDGEITGEDWTYQQSGEKISIRRNVRVVFKENLGNMLK